MKNWKLAVIIVMVLVLGINGAAHAGAVKKLGRGCANVATGWIDIFKTAGESMERHGHVVGAFYGVPAGIVKAIVRTLAGVYEIITFPFPVPEDYKPVVEPEFVMTSPFRKMRTE